MGAEMSGQASQECLSVRSDCFSRRKQAPPDPLVDGAWVAERQVGDELHARRHESQQAQVGDCVHQFYPLLIAYQYFVAKKKSASFFLIFCSVSLSYFRFDVPFVAVMFLYVCVRAPTHTFLPVLHGIIPKAYHTICMLIYAGWKRGEGSCFHHTPPSRFVKFTATGSVLFDTPDPPQGRE